MHNTIYVVSIIYDYTTVVKHLDRYMISYDRGKTVYYFRTCEIYNRYISYIGYCIVIHHAYEISSKVSSKVREFTRNLVYTNKITCVLFTIYKYNAQISYHDRIMLLNLVHTVEQTSHSKISNLKLTKKEKKSSINLE